MKKCKVVITKHAQADLKGKLSYIRDHLKNPWAVQSVYDDYKLTRKTLEEVAETIREPDSIELKNESLNASISKRTTISCCSAFEMIGWR